MAKYILVYDVHTYYDDGGGLKAEEFGNEENEMHERVNELAKELKDKFEVIYAGFLQIEYEYEAVKQVIEYQPKQKG